MHQIEMVSLDQMVLPNHLYLIHFYLQPMFYLIVSNFSAHNAAQQACNGRKARAELIIFYNNTCIPLLRSSSRRSVRILLLEAITVFKLGKGNLLHIG